MIEAEVPHARVDHSVGGESHDSADDRSCEDVVPIVEFIDGKSASDKNSTENRHIGHNQLPVCRMVVGPNFQFCLLKVSGLSCF